MKLYYVYIVRCIDGSYYVGVTNNVEFRVNQHNDGNDYQAYTYTRRPVELVYSEVFKEIVQAIAWEKQIKRWSRAKKEALIDGKWDILHLLAECKNRTNYKNYDPDTKEP